MINEQESSSESPPQSSALDLPRRFGDYELRREIARGAMGVVFEAHQLSLDRVVAIKLILANWLASEEQTARFQREARASAGLQHPNIVPLYEIGVHEGQNYLSLAFVDGAPLTRRIDAGPIPPREAAAILQRVSNAIQYAHDQGILHRDLKPENILLDDQGHPWVLDFGLARIESEEARMTVTGESVGTPSYMSPEQASGIGDLGPGTDIYSLGATLYALLAGRPPFIAPTIMATMRLVQEREPIPLGILNPGIPRDLQTICARCLEKSPRARYESAAQLADDLGRFLEGRPIHARPVGRAERLSRRIRRHPGTSALIALLFVIVCASSITILTQWSRAVNALAAKQQADRDKERSQIVALGAASPEAFNALARQLDLDAPAVQARLAELLANPQGDQRLRFRARLLTLGSAPEALHEAAIESLELSRDPQEFRLAVELLGSALDGAPDPERLQLGARLAQRLSRAETNEQEVFRGAVALVHWDREGGAWREHAPLLAKRLTRVNPLNLAAFVDLLRPFPRELLDELAELFREGDERERLASASLLAACGDHEPELLADLLPLADDQQHPILLAALEDQHSLVLDRMLEVLEPPRELSRPLPSEIPAGPLPPQLMGHFREAHGFLSETSAHCLDMELELFREVCAELRNLEFRPLRVRPFRNHGELCVAAVFTRDDRAWKIQWDSRDVPSSGGGPESDSTLVPIDLASYVVNVDGGHEDRDLILWSEPTSDLRRWFLARGQSSPAFYPAATELIRGGFHPVSLQISLDSGGAFGVDSLWHESFERMESEIVVGLSQAELEKLCSTGLCQVEVDVTARDAEHQVCSGLWSPAPSFESRVLWLDSLEEHELEAEELALEGFKPVAISVLWNDSLGRGRASSVWHRPFIPAQERIAEDRKRSRAAATQLALGALEPALSLLGPSEDPGVRIGTALDLARLGTSPVKLLDALELCQDRDQRFALMIALGKLPRAEFSASLWAQWMIRLDAMWRTETDGGLHSLCLWILRRNGFPLSATDLSTPPDCAWRSGSEGHELVRIDAPREYVMGTAGWIEGRAPAETPQLRRLVRSFEIATTEVTNEQMRRFLDAEPDWSRGHRREQESSPAELISWYQAVAYCRWLSELEGLPEEQMCYPPLSQIGPEMVLVDGHLDRSGYRLPTEAEWEFACRAGARTRYSFGSDPERLGEFANARGPHSREESNRQARPVGLGLPNDLGLFDMHGNVHEWCHDRYSSQPTLGKWVIHTTLNQREELADHPWRGVRGGYYESPSFSTGSASRRRARADTHSQGVGFRIARTIR